MRPFMTRSLSAFCTPSLPLSAVSWSRSIKHHVDADRGGDAGDAGAHEAGADNADFLERRRRHGLRPARALVQLLHGDEQRADHGRRLRRAQHVGEPARFDAQPRVHVHLQAFVDHLQDGAGAGIVVVGLAPVDGVGRREGHHAGLRPHQAARQTETLHVPRRHALVAGLDPFLRGADEIGLRHDLVDQLHRLGAIDLELLALEQELQRVAGRDHARHALGAAGAGEQADLHFRQAEPRLRIVGDDAVMAGEHQFEAAAHAGAIHRGDPRLAAGFQAAVEQRQLAAFLEHHPGGGFLAFAFEQIGIDVAEALQHGEVGAAAEGVLARGDDRALDLLVARHLLDDFSEFLDHARVDDVHRFAGHVPGDKRNAVGVDVEGEVGHGGSPLSLIRHPEVAAAGRPRRMHGPLAVALRGALRAHLRVTVFALSHINTARRSISWRSGIPCRHAQPSCRYRNRWRARLARGCRLRAQAHRGSNG